jgi:hypothetical protein
MDDDDWYEEPGIFFGLGALHGLSDAENQRSRLDGLHSVRNTTSLRAQPQRQQRPIGFHQPKRAR